MLDEKFQDHLEVFGTDEIIFDQGEEGEEFYFIEEGLVDVIVGEGDDVTVTSLGPEEIFGEMALLNEETTRSASIKAQTRVKVYEFSREEFNKFLKDSDKFREYIIDKLMDRIRSSNRSISKLHHYRDRIFDCVNLLFSLMEETGWYGEEDKSNQVNIDSELIANQFNVDQDSVRKIFNITDSARLKRHSGDLQKELIDSVEAILSQALAKLSFEYTDKGLQERFGVQESGTSIEDYLKATKKLITLINNSNDMTMRTYKQIWSQYDNLSDRYESLKEDRGEANGSQPMKNFKAYLEGLRRKLNKIELHELD